MKKVARFLLIGIMAMLLSFNSVSSFAQSTGKTIKDGAVYIGNMTSPRQIAVYGTPAWLFSNMSIAFIKNECAITFNRCAYEIDMNSGGVGNALYSQTSGSMETAYSVKNGNVYIWDSTEGKPKDDDGYLFIFKIDNDFLTLIRTSIEGVDLGIYVYMSNYNKMKIMNEEQLYQIEKAALNKLLFSKHQVSKNEEAKSQVADLKDQASKSKGSGSQVTDLKEDGLSEGEEEKTPEMNNEGLEKNPGDVSMIIEKINFCLKQGRGEDAIADLNKLHEMDPDNASILFILGTIYGDDSREIFDADKAIGYYTEALRVNPEYYDADYNLAALYINLSNKKKTEANKINGFSKKEIERYNNLTKEAEDIMRTGLPYAEKAYRAQPSDDLKYVLKTMYVQLKMMDKARALDAQ